MLFNSVPFIFGFLPITLLALFLVRNGPAAAAKGVLLVASLAFYAWWSPVYLLLLAGTIVVNHRLGLHLQRTRSRGVFAAAITANLAMLGYFKYLNFFVDNINHWTGAHWWAPHVILPLGISFYTFQQIAFLCDSQWGRAERYSLLDYSLFASLFPHLIAGPIVHHDRLIPQFQGGNLRVTASRVAEGLSYFTIGLAKKVLLADTFARFASPVFSQAAAGASITGFEAWAGALGYTFQLYFDFSGYSDMAIGLGLLFGVSFPVNFNSPYKARDLVDFWRRWHITLSSFVRDYLYIPLGGNRHGLAQQLASLLLVMGLVGLWHGAGWTFVAWGLYHGIFLALNHLWNRAKIPLPFVVSAGVTFLVVVVGWVLFRAENLSAAAALFKAMTGLHGAFPDTRLFSRLLGSAAGLSPTVIPNFKSDQILLWLALGFAIAWWGPNTAAIFQRTGRSWRWEIRWEWAVALGVIFCVAVLNLSRVSEFLYFQF